MLQLESFIKKWSFVKWLIDFADHYHIIQKSEVMGIKRTLITECSYKLKKLIPLHTKPADTILIGLISSLPILFSKWYKNFLNFKLNQLKKSKKSMSKPLKYLFKFFEFLISSG